jgi:nicotinate-nucleotide adenylyltransferase
VTAIAASSAGPRAVVAGSVGVLGGTFDPIHFGHLAIAEEARETLGLERVLFVPARVPPHKPGRKITAVDDRVAMVGLAIADNPAFELCELELAREGPSYTVDTLDELVAGARAAGRDPDLTFILSAEALSGILSWREPRRILELARLAVVPRPGHDVPSPAWLREHFGGLEDRLVILGGPHIGISGSEIRAHAAAGRSIRYFVPAAVARYVADHRPYTDSNDTPWRNQRP